MENGARASAKMFSPPLFRAEWDCIFYMQHYIFERISWIISFYTLYLHRKNKYVRFNLK